MPQSEIHNRRDAIDKLAGLIKDVKFAMLTTVMPDGSLRSRPMATQQTEFDGDLWFFTYADSAKNDEIAADRHVNLAYADPDANLYISVSGTAVVLQDKAKAKELWSPAHKAWFPGGVDDPNLAMLKVRVQYAEYWDSPNSKMVQLVGMAKATLTGQRYDPGDDVKLTLEAGQPGEAKPNAPSGRRDPQLHEANAPAKVHGDPLGRAADID